MSETSALAAEIIAEVRSGTYSGCEEWITSILLAKDTQRRADLESLEAMYLKRVQGLLEHNNALLERARAAEALAADRLQALLAAARVGAALAEAIGGGRPS